MTVRAVWQSWRESTLHGIGRTSTLIAIDMALEQAAQENVVEIPAIVTKIRRQCMKMVQNTVREAILFINGVDRMERLQDCSYCTPMSNFSLCDVYSTVCLLVAVTHPGPVCVHP